MATYQVNFDNGFSQMAHSLAEARAYVKNNMYDAKVVNIISIRLDKNSKEIRNYIKF